MKTFRILWRGSFKSFSAFCMTVLVINMSMLGVFFVADEAGATAAACAVFDDMGSTMECENDGYAGLKTCEKICLDDDCAYEEGWYFEWGECVAAEYCGDGIANGTEACDTEGPVSCQTEAGYEGLKSCFDCSWSECESEDYCGDGSINGLEDCDEGNNEAGDGCSATCQIENVIEGCVYESHDYEEGNDERLLGGFKIILEKDDGEGVYSSFKSTRTGEEGSLNFGCFEFIVPDGTYKISQELEYGWIQIAPGQDAYELVAWDGEVLEKSMGVGLIDRILSLFIKKAVAATNSFNFVNYKTCGNGIVDQGEECDDGNNINYDACTNQCKKFSSGRFFAYTNQGSNALTPTPQEEEPEVLGEEGEPTLIITKTANVAFANPGDNNIEFTITVSNEGALAAFNAVLVDAIPDGLSYLDEDGNTKTMEIGDIAAGELKAVTILVNVDDDAEINNYTTTAEVSADNHGPVSATADIEIRKITVLAETGFRLMELLQLLVIAGSLYYVASSLRGKYTV